LNKIKRSATESLDEIWAERVHQLIAQLNVSRPVRLCKSILVEVPTVIGCLRPVILIPASSLTGLTPSQFEAILAHELAHIRRHDYLINLLQNLIETLLFYHPARLHRSPSKGGSSRVLAAKGLKTAIMTCREWPTGSNWNQRNRRGPQLLCGQMDLVSRRIKLQPPKNRLA